MRFYGRLHRGFELHRGRVMREVFQEAPLPIGGTVTAGKDALLDFIKPLTSMQRFAEDATNLVTHSCHPQFPQCHLAAASDFVKGFRHCGHERCQRLSVTSIIARTSFSMASRRTRISSICSRIATSLGPAWNDPGPSG